MQTPDDIHATARSFFLAKIANGALPSVVVGGPADGLRYFATEIAGRCYWLTERGLLTPAEQQSHIDTSKTEKSGGPS